VNPEVSARRDRRWHLGLALAMLPMLVVTTCRLLGPEDLDSNDQAKQALYVLDVWDQGNWILPLEHGTQPATKPPLYTWLAVLASLPCGGPTELTCRVPAILSSLAVAWLLFLLAEERWGLATGVAAAWVFAGMRTVVRLCIHVRPDMLLAALVMAAFFAIHRAERGQPRRMPLLFWAATSLSALTKGPVGPAIILVTVGVLFALNRGWRPALATVVRSRWSLLLLVPIGWFGLAVLVGGGPYVFGTVLPHTVDRVLATGTRTENPHPPGYLLGHFLAGLAPWSLLAGYVLFEVLRRREPAPARHDLWLAGAWLLCGMVLFNLSKGQRKDYLLPLLPAAALLAARALTAAGSRIPDRLWRLSTAVVAAACIFLGVAAWTGWMVPSGPMAAWIAALALAACLAGGASRGPVYDPGRDALGPSFYLGTTAILVLILAYWANLSPLARSRRGAEGSAFASEVNALRTADDLLLIGDGTSNAIRFHTRQNVPDIALEDLSFVQDTKTQGELYLIVLPDLAARVQEHLPGRFRVRLRRPWGHEPPNEILLLQRVVASRSNLRLEHEQAVIPGR